MPKEEILKKHIDKYRKIKVINKSVVATVEQSILEAMEEYAKEESQAFARYMNTHFLCVGMDKYWEEYLKSKIK